MARRTRLIELRLNKGWTQKDMADRLGVTTSFYGMIEQGVRAPKLPMALAIVDLLNLGLENGQRVAVEDVFSDLKPNAMLGDCPESSRSEVDDDAQGE